MTKQIDCSDEAWEIIRTLAPWRATAVKVRAAMPGTPIMPRPSTVIMLKSLMVEMAVTFPLAEIAERVIFVPGNDGLKVFFTHKGMSRSMIGLRVFGCNTFAPK